MSEQYFEMLWDCGQCATQGLLAKSQRHCPACGAAQDPAKRYFPAPGTEVEALGHRYAGVDWLCAYCQSPNGAAAAFCGNCGAPKDGAKEVTRSADAIPEPSVAPLPAAPRSGTSGWGKRIAAAVALLIAVVGYLFFTTHDEPATVIGRQWTREIEIERFAPASDSAWCDALPAGAYEVQRSREQRDTRRVEDGQECQDKRIDKGDGTFTRQQECKPRYRDEPIYDMRCRFRIDRWQLQRTEKTGGDGSLAPAWPVPRLASSGLSQRLGMERAGAQRETYSVQLASKEGQPWQCEVAPSVWAALREQQVLAIKVRGTGGAVCDSLGK